MEKKFRMPAERSIKALEEIVGFMSLELSCRYDEWSVTEFEEVDCI